MSNKIPLFWKWFVGPALLYLVIWIVYTYPAITNFSSHFFADDGDGLQNVWNIWWVNKSATELHQLPYFTSLLHAPNGTTLIGQTMNPINGVLGILLLPIFSLTQTHNLLYLAGFVLGGVTAFWLAYEFVSVDSVTHHGKDGEDFGARGVIPRGKIVNTTLTSESRLGAQKMHQINKRSYGVDAPYWLSIIGGFLFTFSTYHTSHGMGHLQLTTLQWVPLFLLLWWRLINKPTPLLAIGSAVTLFLVQMSDLYYFFYSVIATGILGLYLFLTSQPKIEWLKARYIPLLTFACLAIGLTAPLMLALLGASSADPFLGSHEAITYSADLLSIFNPSPNLHIGALTHTFWPPFMYINMEGYVYLGISVIVVLISGLIIHKRLKGSHMAVWYLMAFIFGILSLGPRLHFNGLLYDSIILPYQYLENLLPPLKLSGVPVRMMFMVTLAAAVIVPVVLSKLASTWRWRPWLIGLFLVVLIVELWPTSLYVTTNTYPAYAYALKDLPAGRVIDISLMNQNQILYHQTLHQKPLAFGSISRTPQSVQTLDDQISATLNDGDVTTLCTKLGFSYLVTMTSHGYALPVLFQDADAKIFDLRLNGQCNEVKPQ